MDNLGERNIAYYLDPSDSTKKADGTDAVLMGEDGDVVEEYPISHYRIDSYTDANGHAHTVKLISDEPFFGSRPFPAFYISPGGETLRKQYLGAYKGFVDGSGKLRSIAGVKPTVSKTRAQFRAAAATNNGGTLSSFLMKIWVGWLFEIEFASTDSQSAVSKGFSEISAYDYAYVRNTGRTNGFGNGTGQIIADGVAPTITTDDGVGTRNPSGDSVGSSHPYAWDFTGHTSYTATASPVVGDSAYDDPTGGTALAITAATAAGTDYDLEWHWINNASKVVSFCYRGLEDPWGALWEFDDAIQKYQNAIAGDYSESGYWFATDTARYSLLDTDKGAGVANSAFPATGYTGANLEWVSQAWPKAAGYIKKYDPLTYFITLGGGSATTYLSDYFFNNAISGARVVLRGGDMTNGARAGAFYVYASNALTIADSSIGGRLAC